MLRTAESDSVGFVDSLEKRQAIVTGKVKSFFKISFVTVAGFAVALLFIELSRKPGLFHNLQNKDSIELVFYLLQRILTFITYIVLALFFIWSIGLVPFIALQAVNATKASKIHSVASSFKWVRLFVIVFIPMAMFALAWLSFGEYHNFSISLDAPYQFIIIFLGAAAIGGVLWLLLNVISKQYSEFRFALLQTLLYSSLYIAFGRGYSLFAYVTLFGILCFIIFSSTQIEEILLWLSLYDIDKDLVEKIEKIGKEKKEIALMADSMQTKEVMLDQQAQKHKLTIKEQETKVREKDIETDAIIMQQRLKLRETQANIMGRGNATIAAIMDSKLDLVQNYFDVVSRELKTRISEQTREQMANLIQNVERDYDSETIAASFRSILEKINKETDGLPKEIMSLQSEMMKLVSDLEANTKKMLDESTEKRDE